MAGKYYWTRKEEAKLLDLVTTGVKDLKVLADRLGRTPEAVRKKLDRMGVVVDQQKNQRTTTTAIAETDLPTHEQALKLLAGALEALREPAQDKLELQRLRLLVDTIQTYDSVLEKFERWVELESRLLAMGEKIAELEKAQKTNAG